MAKSATIQPRNVLVFLPNWVGDVVMATPALRALRRHFAKARITYIGRKVALEALSGCSWADATLADSSGAAGGLGNFARTAMAIRGGKFDLAILLPNSFRTAALARLGGGIKQVVGYDRDGRGWLLSHRLLPQREHGKFVPVPTIQYYNALPAMLGVEGLDNRMELPVEPQDVQAADALLAECVQEATAGGTPTPRAGKMPAPRGPLVMLNPGASFGPSKLWPADRYAALADGLIEAHCARVIINAAPAEKPIARAVAAAMKHEPAINFAERSNSLGLLKALLKRCDLLVTNDTGARHIGAAMGSAVVTIFGSTDPTWARIDYPLERIIRQQVPCGPCQKKQCPNRPGKRFHQCMTAVSVQEVLAASSELLKAGGASRSRQQ